MPVNGPRQPEMSDRFHVSPDLQASVRELTDELSEVPPAVDHFSGSLHIRTATDLSRDSRGSIGRITLKGYADHIRSLWLWRARGSMLQDQCSFNRARADFPWKLAKVLHRVIFYSCFDLLVCVSGWEFIWFSLFLFLFAKHWQMQQNFCWICGFF